MNDYPLGGYPILDSQVVVTKSRAVFTLEGGFGTIGALSAHSAGQQFIGPDVQVATMLFTLNIKRVPLQQVRNLDITFRKTEHHNYECLYVRYRTELVTYCS